MIHTICLLMIHTFCFWEKQKQLFGKSNSQQLTTLQLPRHFSRAERQDNLKIARGCLRIEVH